MIALLAGLFCLGLLFAAGFIAVVFLEAASLPSLKLLVSDDSKPNPDLSSKGDQESTHNRLQ